MNAQQIRDAVARASDAQLQLVAATLDTAVKEFSLKNEYANDLALRTIRKVLVRGVDND